MMILMSDVNVTWPGPGPAPAQMWPALASPEQRNVDKVKIFLSLIIWPGLVWCLPCLPLLAPQLPSPVPGDYYLPWTQEWGHGSEDRRLTCHPWPDDWPWEHRNVDKIQRLQKYSADQVNKIIINKNSCCLSYFSYLLLLLLIMGDKCGPGQRRALSPGHKLDIVKVKTISSS